MYYFQNFIDFLIDNVYKISSYTNINRNTNILIYKTICLLVVQEAKANTHIQIRLEYTRIYKRAKFHIVNDAAISIKLIKECKIFKQCQ